jgi:opacity protein-like surface antigen
MRLTSTILTTLLFSGAVALAQETSETPKVEVGLNYSFTRVNPGSSFSSFNTNGGFGDVEYNVNRHFGLVADLGATYVGTTNGVNFSNTSFEYLFGPRFNVRHGRFNPYIQTLFGGQRFSNGWNPGSADPRLGASQNNFAMAVGGGLNVAVSNHLSVRPFQLDYFLTEVSPNNANYVQNDLRYSAGVVFRFGSK